MKREELYAKLDALYDHVDETRARAETAKTETRAKLGEDVAEAKGRTEAARENIRIGGEKNKSKLNAEMLRLQMNVEQAREERTVARLEHDRKKALRATEKLEDYAADAISIALMAVDEAAYATLDAVDARLTYEETFGTDGE